MIALAQEKNPGRGWVRLWRKFWDSPDLKPEPFTEREAFLWSVTQAAHTPHLQWFNGTQFPVDRGEFVTSLHSMMAAFQWSEKRVRGFGKRMVKAQKWAKRGAYQGAKAPTLLTVCNYDLFQSPQQVEGEVKGEGGAKQGRSKGEEQKNAYNSENEKEEEKLEANASRSLTPALPFGYAIKAWSQVAALKDWKPLKPDLTDKRRKGLGRILKAHGLEGWIAGLQRAADSEMLGGPDPPAWFNFTFVCSFENFTKVSEGNYDRSFSTDRLKRQPNKWLAANAALSRAAASL